MLRHLHADQSVLARACTFQAYAPVLHLLRTVAFAAFIIDEIFMYVTGILSQVTQPGGDLGKVASYAGHAECADLNL